MTAPSGRAVNCLLIVALQTVAVRRTEHARRTRLIACAAGLAVVAMLMFLLADGLPRLSAVGLVLVGVVVYTAGEIIYSPAADALAAEAAPEHLRGRYLAVWQTSWTVSTTVGPVLAGSLLDTGVLALWTVFAVLAALGGAVVLAAEPHLPPAGVRGVDVR